MNYDFKDRRSGSRFPGLQFDLVINGTQKDLTGATVVLTMDGKPMFSTETGGLIFSDRAHGRVQLPAQILNIAPGYYVTELIYYFPGEEPKPYLEGRWNILPKIGNNNY